MTLRTVLLLITLTASRVTFACQCAPDVDKHDCPCSVTINEYIVQFDEIDRLLNATYNDGQERAWIETLPFGWGEILIDWLPALEPDYRRLDRARWQLEDEFFESLGVTSPWQLAARVEGGKAYVYGHEPLGCDSAILACGEKLSRAVCRDADIIYVMGYLPAFLKDPILMNPDQPQEVRYFLLNVDTMEEKPLN